MSKKLKTTNLFNDLGRVLSFINRKRKGEINKPRIFVWLGKHLRR